VHGGFPPCDSYRIFVALATLFLSTLITQACRGFVEFCGLINFL